MHIYEEIADFVVKRCNRLTPHIWQNRAQTKNVFGVTQIRIWRNTDLVRNSWHELADLLMAGRRLAYTTVDSLFVIHNG